MRSTAGTLLALLIGLVLGAAVAAAGVPALTTAVAAIEPLGTLWINAVRMTVIPLVVALIITGVAANPDLRRLGGMGARAVPTFIALLLAGAIFTAIVTPLSFERLTIPPDVAERLRASASGTAEGARQMPTLIQRIVETIPANPVRAAVDGAMLPLVVFSLLFGIALTRLPSEHRDPVTRCFQAVGDAMLVIVGWVLRVAPLGIFALALALAARMGVGAAGALLHYVVTLSGALLLVTVALYPIVAVVARVPLRQFASAALPAQAVAFSSRSSLAALPALITGARDTLGLPPGVIAFVIPLAMSVLRLSGPIAWVVGVLFLGKLYGVTITAGALASLVVTGTLISFSVPGIPSASLFLLAPVLVEMGLPAEGVGILIAVDAIPDMFKTTANVTAHLASAAIVGRFEPQLARGSSQES
jgi:proton glutamate symport protein